MGEDMSRFAFKPAGRLTTTAIAASLAFALNCSVSHQAMAECTGGPPSGGADTITCDNANAPPPGAPYQLGDGNDTLTVNQNPTFSNGGFLRADNIYYTTAAGAPNLQIIAVSGGAGADTFNINGGVFQGAVNGDAGNNIFNIFGGTIHGTLNGGADNDTVTMTGGTIYAGIRTGAGNDTVVITGGTVVGTGGTTTATNLGDGNDKITIGGTANLSNNNVNAGAGSDLIVVNGGRFRDLNGGGGGTDRMFLFGGLAEGAELQSGAGTDPFILFFGGEVRGIERAATNQAPRGSIEVNAGSNGGVVVFDGGKLTGFSEFELQDGANNVSVYFRSGEIDTGSTHVNAGTMDNSSGYFVRESSLEGNNQSNTFVFDPVNSKMAADFQSVAAAASDGSATSLTTANLKDMLGITTGATPAAASNPNAVMSITTNEIEMNGGDDEVRFVGARNFGTGHINLILRSRNAANEIVDEAPEFDGGDGYDVFKVTGTGTVAGGSKLLLGEVEAFEELQVSNYSHLAFEIEAENPGDDLELEFSEKITVDGTSVLQLLPEGDGPLEVELETATLTLLSGTGLPGFFNGVLKQYSPFATGGILQIGAFGEGGDDDDDDGGEASGPIALTIETDTFNNGGTLSMLTGTAGDTVTVEGSYISTANNGKLALDTELGDSSSPTDKLILEGSVAGRTTIYINNVGGKGGFTGQGAEDGIAIVEGDGFSPDAFRLATNALTGNEEIVAGGFAYRLRVNEDEALLQSDVLDQVPAYVSAPSVGQRLVSTGLDTLYKRLGEIRTGQNNGATSADGAVWVRGSFSDVDVDAKEGYDFSQRTNAVMAGLGGVIASDGGARFALGVFGSYAKANADVDAIIFGASSHSSIDADAWSGGAYATYYEVGRAGTGFYFDGVVKGDFINFDMSSAARGIRSSADGDALTASAEVGYGIGLGGGFVVQPQAQIAYGTIAIDSFTDDLGVEASYGSNESMIGRLGLQMQANYVQANGGLISPYVLFNVYSELEGNNRSEISGVEFVSDVSGKWYSAGGGVTAKLADAWSVYGSGEYHFGDVEGWQGSGGVKLNW
jgi:outer membrane autotransporter protein